MRILTDGPSHRGRRAAVAVLAASLLALSACQGQAGGGVDGLPGAQTWRFDDVAPGALPGDVEGLTGRWSVASDPTADGNRVLAQLAANEDPVFNVALLSSPAPADLDLSVRLRAVEGQIDQGGGLVWRARDARNYYIARFNPLEDNVRVYYVEDGHRRQLDTRLVHLEPHAWHVLRVTMQGDHVTCSLDGEPVLEAHDATFPAAGRIGLWTKADAVTHFDDLALVER